MQLDRIKSQSNQIHINVCNLFLLGQKKKYHFNYWMTIHKSTQSILLVNMNERFLNIRSECGPEVNEACRAAAITKASGEVEFQRMCCKVVKVNLIVVVTVAIEV